MPTVRSLQTITASVFLAVAVQGVSSVLPPTIEQSGVGSIELLPSAIAKSSKRINYTPPGTLKRAIRTGGTGSRGCAQLGRVTVMPLVPSNHIGQTQSSRPTFLAYVSGAQSVEFALTEPKVEKPLLVQTVTPDANGIVRVQLPETAPELAIGKDYRWSIAVVCNPNRRSNDVYAQSWIQRTAVTPELEKNLTATPSGLERARLYANAGFWYDAIATLTHALQTNPNQPEAQADFADLLRQANLSDLGITGPTAKPTVTSQSAPSPVNR